MRFLMNQKVRTAVDRLRNDAAESILFQQEETILEITEMICEVMDKKGISRADLAKRLGKSRSFVSHLLNGDRNMTLRTLSDILHSMECRLSSTAVCDGVVVGGDKVSFQVTDVWSSAMTVENFRPCDSISAFNLAG